MSKHKRKRRNRAANRNVSMPRANAAQGQKASGSGPVKPVDTSTRYEWHPHCQKEIEARKANQNNAPKHEDAAYRKGTGQMRHDGAAVHQKEAVEVREGSMAGKPREAKPQEPMRRPKPRQEPGLEPEPVVAEVIEPGKPKAAEKPAGKPPRKAALRRGSNHYLNLVAAVCSLVGLALTAVCLMVLCWAFMSVESHEARTESAAPAEEAVSAPEPSAEAASEEAAPAHVHTWKVEAAGAATHEVEVPAVTEKVVAEHTVCNECGEAIDGKAAAHIEKTGHSGYTTGVPIEEERVVTEATTMTVADEPGEITLVCAECGERAVAPVSEA